MLRVYAVLALIAALLGGFGVYWVHSMYTEKERLQEANEALVADLDRVTTERANEAKVAEDHVKRLTALRGQREKANAELSKATAANPDWAGQRVPDDVLRALGM